MTRKQKKRMQELATVAYERDLSNCLEMLFEQFQRWKQGEHSAWDMAGAVHEFDADVLVTLYRTYNLQDPLFAVAAGVHLGTLTSEEVDDWAWPMIAPVLELLDSSTAETTASVDTDVPPKRAKPKTHRSKDKPSTKQGAAPAPVEALRQIYQVKVTLKGIRPAVWRRILVPSTITLPQLHMVLQAAMGWSDTHLHQFVANDRNYGVPDPDFDGSVTDERRVRLNQIMREEKDSLTYQYDFGDGWEHDVVLEKVLPFDGKTSLPFCSAGKRACPPEDVGGPMGYRNFLRALEDSEHPEHESFRAWIGNEFDAEHFDRRAVNVAFKG